MRTALALAIEQPHLAVTFLPLACTGATIEAGMFSSQRADDCPAVVGIDSCKGTAPAQLAELNELMAAARRQMPQRALDMVLLTIGANDVSFAALVANVVVEATTERILLRQSGGIVSVRIRKKASTKICRSICPPARRAQTLCRRRSRSRRLRLLRQSGHASEG